MIKYFKQYLSSLKLHDKKYKGILNQNIIEKKSIQLRQVEIPTHRTSSVKSEISRNKAIKLPSRIKQDKRKLRVKYLQNSNGVPFIFSKSRGFVGVPTGL